MINYLLLLVAVLFLALDNVLRKRYQLLCGTSMGAGIYYNLLLGVCATLVFWGLNGFRFECTPYSLVMALFQALLGVAYTIIGFRIMKDSVALFALFLMTGGMVIPYVWGLLFLGEAFSPLRLIGLLLILFAVILSHFESSKTDPKKLLLCIVVFFLNGFVSVITKTHQIETGFAVVSSAGFVVLVNFGKLLLSAGVGAAILPRAAQTPWRGKLALILPIVIGSTAVSGTSYLLQLMVASKVSASVMYPMITGGTIIFSALMSRLFYGERPSRRALYGIALCFIGTCLFL